MNVTVIVRKDGWITGTRNVTIADTCPVCGGKRGMPTVRNFCEDGEWYSIDAWTNECGHIDKYVNVLAEAKALRDAQEQVHA